MEEVNFEKNIKNRNKVMSFVSGLNILVNVLIAGVKVVIGFLVDSIAIISEGINNATDSVNAFLALIGSKLSKKRPDEKHPFGYGRIEYLTSLVISIVVLVSGIELIIESIKLFFEPSELSVSYITLIIIGVSALIKFLLGVYTIKKGKQVNSGSLIAVGKDCRNDCFASIITIIASLVFIIFNYSVDAIAGILTSILIIKAGAEILLDTISELLGRAGEKDLADKLYKEIRSTKGVLNAADMMLHNYGPEKYSGSVNIELDHNATVGEVYSVIHKLQLHIMHDYNVVMVFGIYAVDNNGEDVKELRKNIASFIRKTDHILSYHAVYIDKEEKKIYCDFTVDYKLKDWDIISNDFRNYMKELYPDKDLELTVETDFV